MAPPAHANTAIRKPSRFETAVAEPRVAITRATPAKNVRPAEIRNVCPKSFSPKPKAKNAGIARIAANPEAPQPKIESTVANDIWALPYDLGLEELEADREELLDFLDGVFEGEEYDLVVGLYHSIATRNDDFRVADDGADYKPSGQINFAQRLPY